MAYITSNMKMKTYACGEMLKGLERALSKYFILKFLHFRIERHTIGFLPCMPKISIRSNWADTQF